MQPCVERIHGHRVMLRIRCDNHHGVEPGGGKYFAIVAEDQGDAVPTSHVCCALAVPPTDRDDVSAWMALETAQVHAFGIRGRADDTDANAILQGRPAFRSKEHEYHSR
jgi:hypothetical protein